MHRIVPDVTVMRHRHAAHEQNPGGTAVLTTPRSAISSFIEYEVLSDPIRHHFVEIRDSSQGYKLITLIEIVSPSNKRPGLDRQAYERKQHGSARRVTQIWSNWISCAMAGGFCPTSVSKQ